MRKSLVALAATVIGVLALAPAASAQLPPCPPGTSNPGYCEAQPSEEAEKSAESAVKQARKKLAKRGTLMRLLRRKRLPFAVRAQEPGRFRLNTTVRSCGERIVIARGFERVEEAGRVVIALRTTRAGRDYLRRKTILLGLRPNAPRPKPRKECRGLSGGGKQRPPRATLATRFNPDSGPGVTERRRVVIR